MENIYHRLAELIKLYEKEKEATYDEGTYLTYIKVIDDLEYILYGNKYWNKYGNKQIKSKF